MSTQATFHSALLDAARPVPDGLTDGQGRPAGRRYSVYRNNVAVSLTEALETGFPAVRSLVGEDNFRNIAGVYLRREPPTSPILATYGSGFPEFLAGFAPLSHLGYLPDVARLELALRHSYHAADATALDPAALQSLTEDALMAARMTLAPAVRLVTSPWPVVSVRAFALNPEAPKPAPQAEDALITRPAFDPEPHILPKGGADFVRALAADRSFGDAIEAAGGGFDLAATLTLLLTHGAIAALHL